MTRLIKVGFLASILWTHAYGSALAQETSLAVHTEQANDPYDWGWLASVKLELIQSGILGNTLLDIESRLSQDGFHFIGIREIFPVDPGFDPSYDANNPDRTFQTRYSKSENDHGPVTETHIMTMLVKFKRIDGRLVISNLSVNDLGNQSI